MELFKKKSFVTHFKSPSLTTNEDDYRKLRLERVNLFTTIHDGNFRRHPSMNVTIK